MKISGTQRSQEILQELKRKISKSKIVPHLSIVIATNNPAPQMYVRLKTKRAQDIGLKISKYEFNHTQEADALSLIKKLNSDKSVHGILVQLPTYSSWNTEMLINSIAPSKDVDGFLPNSHFKPATGLAVWEMLCEFAKHEGFTSTQNFLKDKKIAILGKGKTAGKPSADILKQHSLNPIIIDSKTENPDEIIIQSDVIISATGIKHIITGEKIKPNSYIIGIGVGKERLGDKETIFGDIDEDSIDSKAKLYCPTIGGIGPLTIACLLKNTVESFLSNP